MTLMRMTFGEFDVSQFLFPDPTFLLVGNRIAGLERHCLVIVLVDSFDLHFGRGNC